MNETLFREIASEDVSKLEEVVQKGYFDTSDFENAVLKTANALSELYQAIKEMNKCH